ncbi:MAG: DUF3703 domain-containing protein [Cytophagaceae bacterium]
MKLNTIIPKGLKNYYNKELEAYKRALHRQELPLAWRHLERAHILGQSYPVEHTAVHWKMLKFGIMIKSWKEVVGQIPRLLIGGVKSFIGKIPVGNTGGANVPPLRPMEIPEDLMLILNQYKQ